MQKQSKVFVAGHRGLVGGAIVRRLNMLGYDNLILRARGELDLQDRNAVNAFYEKERPQYVFLAAAKVGGINANNSYPAEFLHDNLVIQNNVIDGAYRHGIEKLAFLGSSCIYPKFADQPLKEESLLTGSLEPTNEWYAIAKIAGIKLCQAYRRQYGFNAISLMPTNLYGPGDNFDLNNSHVLPAMIRRFHEAKISGASEVTIWGTGTPLREFLHVDDMAEAAVFLMETYNKEDIVNIGVGEDLTILQLAKTVAETVGFTGAISTDPSKPDGTPRKLMDVSRLTSLGWRAKIGLHDGLRDTYRWFLEHQTGLRL